MDHEARAFAARSQTRHCTLANSTTFKPATDHPRKNPPTEPTTNIWPHPSMCNERKKRRGYLLRDGNDAFNRKLSSGSWTITPRR